MQNLKVSSDIDSIATKSGLSFEEQIAADLLNQQAQTVEEDTRPIEERIADKVTCTCYFYHRLRYLLF